MEPATTVIFMFMHLRSCSLLSLALTLALSSGQAYAERPTVRFDWGSTAECHELTTEELGGIYPGEKLVELKLRVSVHLTTGDLDD